MFQRHGERGCVDSFDGYFGRVIGRRIFCTWMKLMAMMILLPPLSPESVCSYYYCTSVASAFVAAVVSDIFTEYHKQLYKETRKFNSNLVYFMHLYFGCL
jgi:hypothetical protein